jgi:chlorophyll(ide) b reductase
VWVPALTGASLGLLYSALHRFCHVRVWAPPRAPLRVVITGGSKGLGKALAREFLAHGDSVVVTGRTQAALDATLRDLHSEVAALMSASSSSSGEEAVPAAAPQLVVHGVVADVSRAEDVEALSAAASRLLGGVDVWVCNAGYSGGYQRFVDTPAATMATITSTNLLGTLLCARAAGRLMKEQPGGGHLFLMDGAGSDGLATPMYTPYGATKAALPQLAASLRGELGPSGVGCHVLSPGMMLTELLLEGATVPNKQAFNLLAEHPETVAAFLVPRARAAVARAATGTYTRYLTPLSAIGRLLAAPVLMGRHFDGAGNPIYPPEHERLLGRKHAKATARRQAAARAQGAGLRLAYSLSLALSVVAFVLDGAAQAGGH